MGIALSLEHGQGHFCRSHILAAVPWRIVAVSLEQCQHRAVGKFCGGFGLCFCNVAITIVFANCVQVRTGKIVAVFYSIRIMASDFANRCIIRDRSNVVAIGDRATITTHNAADSFGIIDAANCANVIAVDDCTRAVKASNTANNAGSAASNAAMVAAIFDHSI